MRAVILDCIYMRLHNGAKTGLSDARLFTAIITIVVLFIGSEIIVYIYIYI